MGRGFTATCQRAFERPAKPGKPSHLSLKNQLLSLLPLLILVLAAPGPRCLRRREPLHLPGPLPPSCRGTREELGKEHAHLVGQAFSNRGARGALKVEARHGRGELETPKQTASDKVACLTTHRGTRTIAKNEQPAAAGGSSWPEGCCLLMGRVTKLITSHCIENGTEAFQPRAHHSYCSMQAH